MMISNTLNTCFREQLFLVSDQWLSNQAIYSQTLLPIHIIKIASFCINRQWKSICFLHFCLVLITTIKAISHDQRKIDLFCTKTLISLFLVLRNSILRSRCEAEEEKHAVFAIQEHWLKPAFRRHQGVNQLKSIHPDYDGYGTSAMASAVENEIIKGRPYGGTGFVYSRSLSLSLRPCPQYTHERITVMELSTAGGTILLINIYLPFYDTRNISYNTNLFKDTVAYAENIIHSNPTCSFVFLMDMNCNIYDPNHVYSKIILEFMHKYRLVSSFDLIINF